MQVTVTVTDCDYGCGDGDGHDDGGVDFAGGGSGVLHLHGAPRFNLTFLTFIHSRYVRMKSFIGPWSITPEELSNDYLFGDVFGRKSKFTKKFMFCSLPLEPSSKNRISPN